MKEINLTQGKAALVDDDDYNRLKKYTWYYHFAKAKRHGYARTTTLKSEGRKQILMHVLIMNRPSELQVDHINRNGLDNRRCNLRRVPQSVNQSNRRKSLKAASIYRGVHMYNRKGRRANWEVVFYKNNIRHRGGTFVSEVDAAKKANEMAKELFGDIFPFNNV